MSVYDAQRRIAMSSGSIPSVVSRPPTGRATIPGQVPRRPETSQDRANDQAFVATKPITSQRPIATVPVPPLPQNRPSGGSSSSSGSSGRSYAGGGGSAAAAAEEAKMKAAFQAAYNDYLEKSDAQYDSFDQTLNRLYNPGIINQRYDAAQGGIGDATVTGRNRVNEALDSQMARNKVATGNIADAFSDGDRALQEIRARFQANDAAQMGGLNSTLGAFGAGQLAGDESGRLDNLFASGQLANQQQATTWAAAQAMNPEIYGATAQSALTGMSLEEAALLRQIAAQRAGDLRQNDITLSTSLNQNARGKLDTNLAIQQALAEMGITREGDV